MTDTPPTEPPLPARLRRALELIYALEGIVGARIWIWTGGVAVGVSVAAGFPHDEALRRVAAAVAPLRTTDEAWDFGLLNAA